MEAINIYKPTHKWVAPPCVVEYSPFRYTKHHKTSPYNNISPQKRCIYLIATAMNSLDSMDTSPINGDGMMDAFPVEHGTLP